MGFDPVCCCQRAAGVPARMRCCRRPPTPLPSPLLQGVSEEVGLIKWPAPAKAALNTLLVIAIVVGTSASLLAINSLLTELSKLY